MNPPTEKLVAELRTLPLGTQLQVVAALLDGLDADCGPGAASAGHGRSAHLVPAHGVPGRAAESSADYATGASTMPGAATAVGYGKNESRDDRVADQ